MAPSLIGIRGIESTTNSFRRKLVASAQELGIEPDHLATIISFESAGSFSPSKRTPLSGCVGLIQFCRPAAIAAAAEAGLKLDGDSALDWLSKMTPEQQLDHVVGYFRRVGKGRKPLTLEQAYLLVFAPSFAFQDPSATAYAQGTKAYDQNKGMDVDKDGKITVADIASRIGAHFRSAQNEPRVPVDGAYLAGVLPGFSMISSAVAAGTAFGYYVLSRYFGKDKRVT